MRQHRRTFVGVVLICASAISLALATAGTAWGAAPPCAELEFAGPIVVNPPSLISGQPATIEVLVVNSGKFNKAKGQEAGSCNAGGFIAQFKTSPGGSLAVTETVSPPLAEGEVELLTFNYDFPKSGNFDTEVALNPAKEVAEINYLNDIKLHSLSVAAAKANPIITNVQVTSVSPTEAVVVNRPATAAITIENTGTIPTSAFNVVWTPKKLAKPLTQSEPAGLLQPGESTTVFLEFTYTSTGTVTSTFTTTGSGKTFSKKSKEFKVEAALPNIRIAEVVEHPEFAGKPSTIEVTIENNGNAGAGPFLVEWKPGKGQPAQIQQVNELPEFGVATLEFTNVFKTPGTYEGTVTVDPTKKVKELFPTEKTATTDMVIPEPTVDLTVTGVTVSSPVTQGSPAKIAITVKNIGNNESPSFVTAWNPNSPFGVSGSGSQTVAKESPGLAPGEETVVNFEFTYPKPGLYRSVAEVNFGRAVKEANYANNALLHEVNVNPAKIALEFQTPLEISPSAIFPKQKGTATFTVVNNGPIATGPFQVTFQQEAGGAKQSKTIAGLNVNESRVETFKVSYAKPGTYTATAVIDPAGAVKKTVTPDEESKTIVVEPKTAEIKLTNNKIKVIFDPGTKTTGGEKFTEWRVYLFAYDPGKSCKVESKSFSGENITKTMSNLAPEGGVNKAPCPSTGLKGGFTPGAEIGIPEAIVNLTEEQPLYVKTKATSYHLNKGKVTHEETSAPGETLLKLTRSLYVNPFKNPYVSQGTGCHDSNGNEEENGDCYTWTTTLEAGKSGIIGPAVVTQHALVKAHAKRQALAEEPNETEVAEELAKAQAAVEAGVQAVEEINRQLEEEVFPGEEEPEE
ncbi:MAG TPA: CARDB domain-containing protein [Solirubrobacteraceae bacterium]|nr:CARDB domain-containing protein [Solirubrobacteraceae bacterium]